MKTEREVARKRSHARRVFPAGDGEPVKDFEGGQRKPMHPEITLCRGQGETRNCGLVKMTKAWPKALAMQGETDLRQD